MEIVILVVGFVICFVTIMFLLFYTIENMNKFKNPLLVYLIAGAVLCLGFLLVSCSETKVTDSSGQKSQRVTKRLVDVVE